MPLFLTDEEFDRCSHDASLVADKADSFIKDLHRQLETLKVQADAAAITSEQTCALLEHKYISLSSDFANLESRNAQLTATIEQHVAELAQVQAEKHKLHINAIDKDGEVERLSVEASDLQKSKRQLLELVEQKDLEISEKNSTIKSYLGKIVNLTDAAALKQAHLHEKEAELARFHAACSRLTQEKELLERHNTWLNEELTAKVTSLIELRKSHSEVDAEMSYKLTDVERQFSECSSSMKWSKERLKELESEMTSMQEELCSSKDAAATNEERLSAEISTVTKLVELYKESSEEWSRKSSELEGVIKALEKHLNQVETGYKEKLEKELSARKQFEKEAVELKEKLEKCEAELEKSRKSDELRLLPISSFTEEKWTRGTETDDLNQNNLLPIPRVPTGVSGTALAASLLRDGWSLAKMYEKYQEAVDALRHECLGRKQSEAILERVLFEIQDKAGMILDERAEHERMMEAYSMMNQKLQQSLSEQVNLESTILDLKADLRRHERDYELAQKEIVDLQKQVTVLVKECRDIQIRCGSAGNIYSDEVTDTSDIEMNDETDTEKVISERLLTFKDINGLVEQNVHLRSLVRSLADQNAKRDAELRAGFEVELQKKMDEAAAKVAAVMKRSEEQGAMIESLHSSVAMYKRMYEEELKIHGSYSHFSEALPDTGRKDLMLLLEGTQDASKKTQEQVTECVKNLEEELEKSRSEVITLRMERDKSAMQANFAQDRLDRFMKECEHQRAEVNGVLARNVEFSQMIVDYQRKLREGADSVHAAEDASRKLTVEVSLLNNEKELLVISEKRASDEVRSLSERVYRLQATLDTIQSADEVREDSRAMEARKREEYLQQVEREWAQVKMKLQEERDNVRKLTLDKEHTLKDALRQVEEMGKRLTDALHNVAAAEARAAIAEARCRDLEAKLKTPQDKDVADDGALVHSASSNNELTMDLVKAKEEIGKLKEEAQANKDHMLQYKSIAQVNEAALKQIESAHEKFKDETDKAKKSLEAEILSLQERISELEDYSISKSKEAASSVAESRATLDSALAEISNLKEENSTKLSQISGMEMQISCLKEDLEKEHERWRSALDNYERQVILQSETIQELTKTSQALAALQEEASVLSKFADTQKNENYRLTEKMETEKSFLEQAKNKAEKKYNEINEQNKILHHRLEALHIKLAEKERNYAGISSEHVSPDSHGDGDLQTVVNYLRRSKEIGEIEISLLKQEKLRLQSQLESALKASETAQSLLQAERTRSRASLFSDEEFKSLQIQVKEMNLLRESNMQLREENKHNFEECQKLREVAQKAKVDYESSVTLLRENQIEVDAHKKGIEIQNREKGNLENRINELLQTCKNVDLETYERMKDEYQQMQVKLRQAEAELEQTARAVSEKQNTISGLEQDIASTRMELTEREKRINDSLQVETTLKSDVEKQRRLVAHFKKKLETLSKEKEELNKEKQSLSKQLEDSKQGKRTAGDAINEQVMKEKDTRIQILEKILERERDELRKQKDDNQKEKVRRQKTEKTVMNLVATVNQEKKKLIDELERYKHVKDNLPEHVGSVAQAAQVPVENALDNQTGAYTKAVENLEVTANNMVNEELGGRTPIVETSLAVDTSSAAATACQVPAQASSAPYSVVTTHGLSQSKLADEKEKRSNLSKPSTEGRKMGRRLVRPRLGRPEEPSGDTEMTEMDGSSAEGKVIGSLDVDPQSDAVQSSARKRLASSLGPESCESQVQSETSYGIPLSKKSKGVDSPQEIAEEQPTGPPENLEPAPALDDSFDGASDQLQSANELVTDAEKNEVHATGDQAEEPKESPLDETGPGETQNELIDTSEEFFDNIEGLKDVEGQDMANIEVGAEREEGELLPDAIEEDGDDMPIMVTSTVAAEVQHELVTATEPSGEEGAVVFTAGEVVEATQEIVLNEKKDMDEGTEEIAEDSDKSNNDQEAGEIEQSPRAALDADGSSSLSNLAESTASKQGSVSTISEMEESKEALLAERSTTINLIERARQRAELRQAAAVVSRTPPARRGGRRGSRVTRGRGQGRQGSHDGQG